MIKNIQVQALIHNEMYQFEKCTPVYLNLLIYFAKLYDSGSYEKRIEVQEHHWLLARQDIYSASFWWSMNEAPKWVG